MKRRTLLACVFVCGAASSAGAQTDPVLASNVMAIDAIRTAGTPPPVASRALAILHASIYDAVNGIARTHEPFFVRSAGPASASLEAAAVSAAHRALVLLFPARSEAFDVFRQTWLSTIPNGPHKTTGIAWGELVANEIIAWRASDNADAAIPAPAYAGPGSWVPTPPSFASYLLPAWGGVTPFAMPSNAMFRPPGPPSLESAEWAADYNEVKAYGASVDSVRTSEQDLIALFWADGPGTETPPGHWNRIAREVAVTFGNTVEQNARLFALLNVAMADAAICAWDAKYAFHFWRPITAIRNGDTDDNSATLADSEWSPFIATPAFPEYVSGHSAFSGAAARVLTSFYGGDAVSFSIGSDFVADVKRQFHSFSEAAVEAAVSRLYGGIHFRSAIQDGLTAGLQIGEWTVTHTMETKQNRSRR